MPKVAICTPTRAVPSKPFTESLAASLPLLAAAGWEVVSGTPEFGPLTLEVGCPYISHARAKMLRLALDQGADAVIFVDDDVSWQPDALLRLLKVDEPVVCGTYRFKREPESYMGDWLPDANGKPMATMKEGQAMVVMYTIPAGFLKVTREAVNTYMRAFPELCFGEPVSPFVDLFQHGAHEGTWWGEDYAFARRWREKCGVIWCLPDIGIDHHAGDTVYLGNYDAFLRH